MRIFALGDLHFSFDAQGVEYKPMDIFGFKWENHAQKIEENWHKTVSQDDVVLVPGDISWALKLEEAIYDLNFLGKLPGLKIIVKGNHDLWWQSLTKVRGVLPPQTVALQNNHVLLENGIAICGTRGWDCPGSINYNGPDDEKVYKREVHRLRLSLESVKEEVREIIVMLHYPPTNNKHELSGFIELLLEYKVKTCIYGHLHSDAIKNALPEEKWGINFHLVSADAVNFSPKLIYLD